MEATPIDALVIEAQVVEVLHTCFDPEIPVNIYELGLVNEINVDASRAVVLRMTLTSPGCQAAPSLPVEVPPECRPFRAFPQPRSKSCGTRLGPRA